MVVDLGTGCIPLGHALAAEPDPAGRLRKLAVLLTHTQIDHIQGLPFFAPAVAPGWDLTLLGPSFAGRDISGILDGALNPNYSPLYSVENLGAKLALRTLTEGELAWEGMHVRVRELPHGNTRAFGLRVEADGAAVALIPDILPGAGHPPAAALALASEVDVLVHDAMEVPRGPSRLWRRQVNATPEQALTVARESGAKALYLYHHDPDTTDPTLDRRLAELRRDADGVRVDAAREGESFVLGVSGTAA